MKNNIKNNINIFSKNLTAFFKWLLLGALTGAICGAVGAGFAHSIDYVVELRAQFPWLLYLLPVGGIAIVALYKLLRVNGVGTDNVLASVRSGEKIPVLLAPAIFAGSVMSHMFGASVGREGAALQLGGSVSSLISKIFRLDKKSAQILTICGMGAVFSALFGTPLGASVFALEVVSVGCIYSGAVFPCIISGVAAYIVANLMGVSGESFLLKSIPEISFDSMWKVFVVAIAGAVMAVIFCHALRKTSGLLKKLFKNPYLKIAVGGALVVVLTLLVGTTDYNSGGIHIIEKIISHGEVNFEAFALKFLFTLLSVCAGYKGGQIIPTMFIGSTMGGSIALLIGLDPALGAAVGIAAMFCGVTNCPIATIIISMELFGAQGGIFFAVATVIGFLLSGNTSLYSKQNFIFSKINNVSSITQLEESV